MIVCGMVEAVANKRAYAHAWGRTRNFMDDRPEVNRMMRDPSLFGMDVFSRETSVSDPWLFGSHYRDHDSIG